MMADTLQGAVSVDLGTWNYGTDIVPVRREFHPTLAQIKAAQDQAGTR